MENINKSTVAVEIPITRHEKAKKKISKRTLNTIKILKYILFYAVISFVAIVMFLPFYWSLLTSFRINSEILKLPIKWYPTSFTFEHYITVFREVEIVRMFLNSIITTLAGLFTNLFFGTLAAYSFAKIKFSGHKIVFNVMLISLMIPGVITLVPTFLVILRFPLIGGNNLFGQGGIGFYDNLAAVVLPGAVGVYGIFFMRQFFVTLPDDYAESARIDGASEFKIFYKIYLPLVLPGLMTLGIFTFQGGWNSFMWPNIVLISDTNQLLTMAFKSFQSSTLKQYGPLMAVSLLMALPILILYIFAQKYFIKGIAVGGTKG